MASSVATEAGLTRVKDSPRLVINRYYALVRSVDFDEIKHYSEVRRPLLDQGRAVQRLLIEDLQAGSTSNDNRIKAMFGLAAFVESGKPGCEGLLFPVLIDLLVSPDDNIRSWVQWLMEEISGQPFGADRRKWKEWWSTVGKKRFRDTCTNGSSNSK